MKKLYRNEWNGQIGGVCEGLGEYFNMDPTLVRLLFVIGAFAGASSIIAYIILWIVVPDK